MTKQPSDVEMHRNTSNLSDDLFSQSIANTLKSDDEVQVDVEYLKFMKTFKQGERRRTTQTSIE